MLQLTPQLPFSMVCAAPTCRATKDEGSGFIYREVVTLLRYLWHGIGIFNVRPIKILPIFPESGPHLHAPVLLESTELSFCEAVRMIDNQQPNCVPEIVLHNKPAFDTGEVGMNIEIFKRITNGS